MSISRRSFALRAAASAALLLTVAVVDGEPARVASNPPPLSATPPAASSRIVANPSLLSIIPIAASGGSHNLALTASPSAPGEKRLDLHVVFTTSKLYNPATDHWDVVRLRSYAGTDAGLGGAYVAPTIPVSPGYTIDIVLRSDLTADPGCDAKGR